jgi:lipopolysaccharide transport system permease protein
MFKIKSDTWSLIIRPDYLWNLKLKELWQYRDLIFLFVHRDFVSQYKQTVLGPLWYFVQPFLSTTVLYLIFGKIAHISTEGLPSYLFYFAGTIAWNFFSGCFLSTSNTFVTNAALYEKVYFPRLCIPVASVINRTASFAVQLLLFLIVYTYFILNGANFHPTIWILFTPALLLQMAILGLGIGMIMSSLTTKYRDLQFLTSFGLQLWFYATPIVFPLSIVPVKYHSLFYLNPMAPVVEFFRFSFTGTGTVDILSIIASLLLTSLLFFAGLFLFNRTQSTFLDTV